MRHVLVVWELGGNRGHLERLHVAALALRARGLRVSFVLRDLQTAQDWLQARGWPYERAPAPPRDRWNEVGPTGVHEQPSGHAQWFLREGIADVQGVRRLLHDWRQLIDKTGADAALLDYAPSAAYALHCLQVPFLTLGTGFCTPPVMPGDAREQPVACFQPWDAAVRARAQAAQQELASVFASLRQQLGDAAPLSMHELFTAERVALCTLAELDHFGRHAPEHGAFHGVIWGGGDGSLPRLPWPDCAAPKLLCYLNAPADALLPVLAQLQMQAQRSEANVIAVLPRLSETQAQALQGSRLQISRTPLDVQHLLAQADGCITQGGLAMSAMALQCGVPLLMLPRYAEQALLSRRLVHQGLAVATVQPAQQLGQRLHTLLHDAALRMRVQAFAAAYRDITPQTAVESALGAWLKVRAPAAASPSALARPAHRLNGRASG